MKIFDPQSLVQSISVMQEIDELEFFVVEDHPDELLETTFWLGSSKDCKLWAMFVNKTPFEEEDNTRIAPQKIVAWLTDPPENNSKVIGNILFDTYTKLLKGKKLNAQLIQKIIKSHPFPEYQKVLEFLPEAPKDWLELPVEITVEFELSEGACLYKAIWEEYQRDSFKDVVATLFGPRLDGLLLGYSLRVRGLIPLMPYEIDWPLARRGKETPYKRSKVQGEVPWKEEANTALLVLYQSLPSSGFFCAPSYFAKPTVRLCVAGSDAENAITNWYRIAKILRKLKKTVT